MTLTELIVYCLLLSLFGLMLFLNLPHRTDATTEDMHQAATIASKALARLSLELGNASASSVTQSKTPPGVMFLSANADGYSSFSYLSTGELAWLGWIGYFLDGGKLERVWYPFKAGVVRSAVTSTPVALELLRTGSPQILADGVAGFTVTAQSDNLWQFDLELSIEGSELTLTSGTGARN
jgi:hypothetical protein